MKSTDSALSRWETETKNYSRPHLRLRQVASLVKSHRPERMLDIGCSEGYLRNLCLPVEYYGCDFVRPATEPNFKFAVCDLSNDSVPFAGEHFDVVTCSGVLEYVANVDRLFREVRQRLRPGGRLILTYFNMHHLSRRIQGRRSYVREDWKNNFPLSSLLSILSRNEYQITAGYAMKHSLQGSSSIELTVDWPFELPRLRWFSSLLAQQFILDCSPKDSKQPGEFNVR